MIHVQPRAKKIWAGKQDYDRADHGRYTTTTGAGEQRSSAPAGGVVWAAPADPRAAVDLAWGRLHFGLPDCLVAGHMVGGGKVGGTSGERLRAAQPLGNLQ